MTSLKDRESGERKTIKLFFSRKTLRFYNDRTKETVTYSWEKGMKDVKIESDDWTVCPEEQCPWDKEM